MGTKILLAALALILSVTNLILAQATAPTSQPLQATVTHLTGSAQIRKSEDDPWQQVKVGMIVNEGAEIRTGIRSKVIFHIPPDQDIVIARVTIAKLLLARGTTEEVQTRIGMPYGRTQYLVEQAGLQHNAQITSPGATLAVRGTKEMLLYDQGPFTPIAYASQPVKLKNAKGHTIAFGKSGGRSHVDTDKNSPGEQALIDSRVDPAGKFSGRTPSENVLLSYLARVSPNFDVSQYRLLALIADPNFKGTVAAVLPIAGQLNFTMFWQDISGSDLDLAVTSPLGERVSFKNQKVKSSGHYLGGGKGQNGVGDKGGFGQEAIVWETSYPAGKYTIETCLKNAKSQSVTANIFVIKDPLTKGEQIGNFTTPVGRSVCAINTVDVAAPGKSNGGNSISSPAAIRRR